ncbi:MAG: hypothetical protein CM15mP116_09920 [Synechococcus sp.]|nr:MAG: hypothetical protein CM15mP116_09920 [Synechococcus sp.]
MNTPRSIKRLGTSLLIGGQAVAATLRGRINRGELFEQLLEAGPGSVLIVLIISVAAGSVFNIQVAAELTRQGAGSTVGGILAIGLAREIAPLLTSCLLAGKVATAYAAQLGTMKVTEQIDAITMLRTDPVEYLVVPRMIAMVVMAPVQCFFFFLVAVWSGQLTSTALYNIPSGGVLDLGADLDEPAGPALHAGESPGVRADHRDGGLRLGPDHPRWSQGSGHQHHRCGGDDPDPGGPDGCRSHPGAVRSMSSTPAPVTLKPDVRLPLLVVALGLALLPLPFSPWPTFVVALFGLFLLIQSASLRLEFKEDALIVWQNSRELRRFPYDQWLSWRLFAPGCRACFISAKPRAFTSCRSCSAPRSCGNSWNCGWERWKCRRTGRHTA